MVLVKEVDISLEPLDVSLLDAVRELTTRRGGRELGLGYEQFVLKAPDHFADVGELVG
jgi:hypothetical protein